MMRVSAMPTCGEPAVSRRREMGAFFCARPVERLCEHVEPVVVRVCWAIWGDVVAECPSLCRVVDLEDLLQEGRIAVFEAAEYLGGARSPRALAAAVVRTRVRNSLRRFLPRADAAAAPELTGGEVEPN